MAAGLPEPNMCRDIYIYISKKRSLTSISSFMSVVDLGCHTTL